MINILFTANSDGLGPYSWSVFILELSGLPDEDFDSNTSLASMTTSQIAHTTCQ